MMISRRLLLAGLASFPALRWAVPGSAARADEPTSLLGGGTAAVVRLDLARLDVAALARRLFEAPGAAGRAGAAAEFVERMAALRRAGATELFALIDLADFPGPPLLAVPGVPGADPRAIGAALVRGVPGSAADEAVGEVIRGSVVAGTPAAVKRLRDAEPTSRPDLAAAIAAGPADAGLQVAISPGRAFRRAIEESLDGLPAPLGGGPVATLTQGMIWAAVAFPADPQPARLTIQARDPAAADALAKLARAGLRAATDSLATGDRSKALAPRLAQVEPSVRGDRVVASVDAEALITLLAIRLREAREATEHARSVDNLKNLGLAMHNYHSDHDTLPPAFRVDRARRPLLSWRVLVLPYIDQQQKLYAEFHLDEPWDSPHNTALIGRMPQVFAAPSQSPASIAAGKTIYLTPRGGRTMFPGETAIPFKGVTDGLSNTIMVLQADEERARVWTSPEDWEVEADMPAPGGRRLVVTMGDGSARRFPADLRPEVLRALVTRDGGEEIDWSRI